MGDIKLDSGTIYFNDDLLELKDVVIGVDYADEEDMTSYVNIGTPQEVCFECNTRFSKELLMHISGVTDAVIELCPNKRVVHLIKHARKVRTRKKNFELAIRILEKER